MTLLRNAALSSGVQYIEAVVGIATGVLIARTLGPTQYGHYAFAVWLCGWLILASNNGLTVSAIRFIAEFRGSRKPEVVDALGSTLLRWQTVCTGIVVTVFVAVALVQSPQDWSQHLLWMILLVCVGVIARARFWMLSSIGKGFERFEPECYSILVMVAANLITLCLWWRFDKSVLTAFAIYAMTGVLCCLVAQRLVKSCGIKLQAATLPAETRSRVVRTVFSSGVMISIGLLSSRTLEIGLLKAYWSAETIAYFVIAGTLTKGAVDLLTTGLASVLLPAISRAFGRSGQARAGKIMSESIRYYWFIGLLICGIALVVTRGAVSFLYGVSYEAAIPAVTGMLVIAGLGAFAGAFNAFQIASNLQTDQIWTAIATLGVNIVAAVALVPTWGLSGAIISMAITRAVSVLIQFFMVRRRIKVRIKWEVLFRLLFSALVACELGIIVETLFVSRFSFVVSAIIFIACFLGISVLMRSWYTRDYALATELAARLGPVGQKLAILCRRISRRFAI